VSTDRDVDRIVRSWMDEGVTQLPDRVLDLVLDQVPSTPQRRSWWPARRFTIMNTYARLGLVAAAVVVAVAIGIGIYGRSNSVGPPVPTPSLTASPTPAANPLAGTWVAPETTCAQQNATVGAAGFTAEDLASSGWNCGSASKFSIVFDGLPVAATIRGSRIYDRGALTSTNTYRLTGQSRFEFGTGPLTDWCITFGYAINGDELTISTIDHGCPSTGPAQLLDQVALTAILETSPFTRQP
jgi:hypothetical protein